MNKLQSTMLMGAGVATIGLGGVGLAHSASALTASSDTSAETSVTGTNGKESFMAELATKLAAKLNIEESKVESALDELHQERIDERSQQRQAKLEGALAAKTITQAQYDYLLSASKKMEELKASMKDAADSDKAAIKEEIKENREELRTWAKDQNIVLGDVFGSEKKRHHGGHGRGMEQNNNEQSDS